MMFCLSKYGGNDGEVEYRKAFQCCFGYVLMTLFVTRIRLKARPTMLRVGSEDKEKTVPRPSVHFLSGKRTKLRQRVVKAK